MSKKEVRARAERITRLLPRIMGSIAHWHDKMSVSLGENGRVEGPIGEIAIGGGSGSKLTFNQYQALTVIRELNECSVNELAARLHLAQSTTSQFVDRLVKGGFVSRETSSNDRRRIVIRLSKSGTLMLERRKQSLLDAYEQILLSLDESDQEMLEDAFDKFSRIASKLNQLQAKREDNA
jgi:DNA-binding MarR family transcriptional regulator